MSATSTANDIRPKHQDRARQPPSVPESRDGLAVFIASAAGAASARIGDLQRLSGGAIQQNWALDVEIFGGPRAGRHQLVLRTDPLASHGASLSRAEEFHVLQAVHQAGVVVPEPLWLCQDLDVLGQDFYLMRLITGTTAGHRVVREVETEGSGAALAAALGSNLAKLHSIRPGHPGLEFLREAPDSPARQCITDYRAFLDGARQPYPVLEWALRWCELNLPEQEDVTLIHRDFRTGNYVVGADGLSGILDWEFAGWGNPLEDIGWCFCKFWRFGRDDKRAGGIAPQEAFLDAYQQESGRQVSEADLVFWEVMANVRWSIVALQQAERHLSGKERSLELALTGRIPAELELEILRLTRQDNDTRG